MINFSTRFIAHMTHFSHYIEYCFEHIDAAHLIEYEEKEAFHSFSAFNGVMLMNIEWEHFPRGVFAICCCEAVVLIQIHFLEGRSQ